MEYEILSNERKSNRLSNKFVFVLLILLLIIQHDKQFQWEKRTIEIIKRNKNIWHVNSNNEGIYLMTI